MRQIAPSPCRSGVNEWQSPLMVSNTGKTRGGSRGLETVRSASLFWTLAGSQRRCPKRGNMTGCREVAECDGGRRNENLARHRNDPVAARRRRIDELFLVLFEFTTGSFKIVSRASTTFPLSALAVRAPPSPVWRQKLSFITSMQIRGVFVSNILGNGPVVPAVVALGPNPAGIVCHSTLPAVFAGYRR
jgi:hypothetical protein